MTCFLTLKDGSSWWEVPPPSEYVVIDNAIYSQQGSQRDTSGGMHLDLIAIKAQITLHWRAMSPTAFVRLCSVTGQGGVVSCRYFDPQTGTVKGTTSSPARFYRDSGFSYVPVGGWTDSGGEYHPTDVLPDAGDGSVSLSPLAYEVSMTLTEM